MKCGRNLRAFGRLSALTLFLTAAGCNDLGLIPTVDYPDCTETKDEIWLTLGQLDFGFFCDKCEDDVECKVSETCSGTGGSLGFCYTTNDDTDPCSPGLAQSVQDELLWERRVGLLAPLYDCRDDEQVAGHCPEDIKRRAAEEFLDRVTGDTCNPCDELTWMMCQCQFDPQTEPDSNLMLICLVADGGRKANPLWSGYVQTQEIDCQATINDFACENFFLD